MNRRQRKQIAIHEFPSGFGGTRIFAENRWVKLAKIIPWDLVDRKYAENFEGSNTGNPSIESRIAFGAIIIKQDLGLSDEDTVLMIQENPHCQYFLGMSEFTEQAPFDSSKMVAFRKRFSPQAMAEINEAIISSDRKSPPPAAGGDDRTEENSGTMILDATCTPADIHFPTDAGILNDARKLSEKLIDELFVPGPGCKKPRTHRKKARKAYLLLVRNKKPGYKFIRKTLRGQLQYLNRNLGHIRELSQTNTMSDRQHSTFNVLNEMYDQQKQMYDRKEHKVDNRIVSAHQPWVRPIVRGKLTANTEFGAKLALSMEDGYARIEKLSWDAFNESGTLIESCNRYKERNGFYPKRILADKIYRSRDNLNYCAKHGIKMNGPKLGRPPKDKKLYEQQKYLERSEAGERNAIEGKFGEAKTRYGLDRVMAHLSDTSETVIHMTILVMNLKKRLRNLFDFISHLLYFFFPGLPAVKTTVGQ